MKALVGAYNQEKALVGAFSVIVQPVVEPMDRFAALDLIQFKLCTLRCTGPARPQPAAKTGTKDKYLKSCSIAELRLVVVWSLELPTKVPEDFTITDKAPNRAFSWLKVPTSALTFETTLKYYAS